MNTAKLRIQSERVRDVQIALLKFARETSEPKLKQALELTASSIGAGASSIDQCIRLHDICQRLNGTGEDKGD